MKNFLFYFLFDFIQHAVAVGGNFTVSSGIGDLSDNKKQH